MKKPTLRQAINAFCLDCQHDDVFAIANCAKVECALHLVRPNQVLEGHTQDEYDRDDLIQAVEDSLMFPTLKEQGLEYL
jgi:hypothetical protein